MVVESMETESHGHVKRKNTSNEEGNSEGKKARKQFDRTGKNSLQVLAYEFNNKGNQPIDFQFEDVGESGKPSFKALAELEGVRFEAVGSSKMIAKRLLASKALAQLRSIFISPDYPDKEVADTSELGDNAFQDLKQEFNGGRSVDVLFNMIDSTPNKHVFKAEAEIKGISFEGVGTSKTLAKRDLARKALAKLRNAPLAPGAVKNMGDGAVNVYNPFDISATLLQAGKKKFDVEKAQRSPLMVFSELHPDVDLKWGELGRGGKRYKVEAVVDGVTFFGEGRNKKLAKTELAKSVLMCLHDVPAFKESEDESEKVKSEKASKKKTVVLQLKEVAGEDITIQLDRQEGAEKESAYRATIVAKGTAFEAVASNKFGAKVKAAKKALAALQPKVVVDPNVIDVNLHPNAAFHQHFKDVRINASQVDNKDGTREQSMETTIQGRKFRITAANKKKAKLQLVLKVFEGLRNVKPTQWTAIDLNEVNGK